MLIELPDAQFTCLELEITVFAEILSSVTTSKERERELERMGNGEEDSCEQSGC